MNILFGNLIVEDQNKKTITLKDVVFEENAKIYFNRKQKKEYKIKAILKSKIIGQTKKSKNFTNVKKSNETRNKKSGSYE